MSRADNSVKHWKKLPLVIPNQISFISMHVHKFGSMSFDIYSSYRPETKIWACLRLITLSKFDEICPLTVPNQIFTISIHIPNLAKIHLYLLKLSSGNEIRTDGRMDVRPMGGRTKTHGRPTWNHNTPPLSCGGVYKKWWNYDIKAHNGRGWNTIPERVMFHFLGEVTLSKLFCILSEKKKCLL